jgi:alkylhydroperoxidase family enzyme
MELTMYTPDSAPDASAPILKSIADDTGFVPNIAAVVANSPALMAAFDGMRRALPITSISAIDREVAGLAVDVAVDSAYGIAFHSTLLDRLEMPGEEVGRMRSGEEPDDPRAAAVYKLARAIVLNRGKIDDSAVSEALAEGLTVEQILDVVTVCTFAGLIGTIDNLAGRLPLDEFIRARADA